MDKALKDSGAEQRGSVTDIIAACLMVSGFLLSSTSRSWDISNGDVCREAVQSPERKAGMVERLLMSTALLIFIHCIGRPILTYCSFLPALQQIHLGKYMNVMPHVSLSSSLYSWHVIYNCLSVCQYSYTFILSIIKYSLSCNVILKEFKLVWTTWHVSF